MSTTQQTPDQPGSQWETTQTANLVRYSTSGVYFARLRVHGKLHRQSLKTGDYTTAKRKLAALELRLRNQSKDAYSGKFPFGEALTELRELGYRSGKTKAGKKAKPLKARTRQYYEEVIERLRKSWQARFKTDIEESLLVKIGEDDLQKWANTFAPGNDLVAADYGGKAMSSSSYNHTVTVLWHAFQIGVHKGVLLKNPADVLGRATGQSKRIILPSPEEFQRLVAEIESPASGQRSGFSKPCADFVRFLSFTGCRLGEAKEVRWQDCNFTFKTITIWGHPETRTKNGEHRVIPMIPELETMLRTWRDARSDEQPDAKVLEVFEAQKAIDRACRVAGVHRITHHDCRHLFATRALQCGVDVRTVAGWLGHKDNGALVLKTYSHLMPQHSAAMAAKVTFGTEVKEAA